MERENEKIQYETIILVRKRVIGASLVLWNGNKLSQWKQQVITLKKLNYPNARHNAWVAAPLKRTRASSCNRILSSLRRLIEKHTFARETHIRERGWKSAKRRKTLFVSHAPFNFRRGRFGRVCLACYHLSNAHIRRNCVLQPFPRVMKHSQVLKSVCAFFSFLQNNHRFEKFKCSQYSSLEL